MNAAVHAAAPLCGNEPQRLEALASYGILDTPVEAAFEDITRIASQICKTPIAVVNLIDRGRQWFKSEIGLGVRETPLDTSICAHAILQPALFEIPDTTLDPRFSANPLVTGNPHLRFYAGAPLRTPDGYQLGTVCVLDHQPRALDAQQREALEALARQTMALLELRRTLLNTEAIQKNLRRLMATAGHDLRQPLQAIGLTMEFAKRKSTDAVVVHQLDSGLDAARRLGRELDELARASIAAAGLNEPQNSRLAVQDSFDSLRLQWLPIAQRKNLQLRFAPSAVQLSTDRRMLDTILGNLVGNAIKYTTSGRILVGCRRGSEQVRIDVIDTGVGIPEALQASIFDPFRKADARSDGLGLGLSIVRSTAALIGAQLQLHSVPDRGTRFSLSLPRTA